MLSHHARNEACELKFLIPKNFKGKSYRLIICAVLTETIPFFLKIFIKKNFNEIAIKHQKNKVFFM